jgi:MATE family multidrug resistance protein
MTDSGADNSGDSVIFAGVSLANMYVNVSLVGFMIGMTSAVETLVSQNNGSGNFREVGIVLQRSVLILTVMAVPLAMSWYFIEDICELIGLEKAVTEVVKTYLFIRAVAIPADIIQNSYSKYVIAIGVVNPPMLGNITMIASITVLDVLFIHVLGYGYQYLAWAWVISAYFSLIALIGSSLFYESVRLTLQPPDRESLTKWSSFVSLGGPGTLMLVAEWWSWEVLTVLASFLGTNEIAAQNIMAQISSLVYMIPYGLGIAASSKVGNALGSGNSTLARSYAMVSIQAVFIVDVIMGVIVWVLGDFLIGIFTTDAEVLRIGHMMVPYLSLFCMCDGLYAVTGGILRGVGKQNVGGFANLTGYFVFGLPIGAALCFYTYLRVRGLLLGMACGTIVIDAFVFGYLILYDGVIYNAKGGEAARLVDPSARAGASESTAGRKIADYTLLQSDPGEIPASALEIDTV